MLDPVFFHVFTAVIEYIVNLAKAYLRIFIV